MEIREELALRNEVIDMARKGLKIFCYGMEMDIPYFVETVPPEDVYGYVVDNEHGWIYVSCHSTDLADLIDMEEIARQIAIEELLEAAAIAEAKSKLKDSNDGFKQYVRVNHRNNRYKH